MSGWNGGGGGGGGFGGGGGGGGGRGRGRGGGGGFGGGGQQGGGQQQGGGFGNGGNGFGGQQGGGQQGGFGGGGGGGRGRGRGRNFRGGGRGQHLAPGGEAGMSEVCRFFVQQGQCRNGDRCNFSHSLSVFSVVPAHPGSIKTMAMGEIGGQPKILTGGSEHAIKVWSFMNGTVALETQRQTQGSIEDIEVSGQTIFFSAEEPLPVTPADTPAGIVYMLDQGTGNTLPVTREDVPFTHQQKVNCIRVVDAYVLTAGTEGLIRAWQFVAAEGKFQQVALLEGHIRSVTSLLYSAPFLWSGSFDATLRVWEMASGRCVGCIGSGPTNANGHTAAIVCLEMIPTTQPELESYVASGGADGDVRLWKTTGDFLHSCSHGTPVSALRCFQDAFGGQQALIIGLFDGRIILRSCATMNIIFALPNNILPSNVPTTAVWSIISLGATTSCFATGGDDGQLVVWRISQALVDTSVGQT